MAQARSFRLGTEAGPCRCYTRCHRHAYASCVCRTLREGVAHVGEVRAIVPMRGCSMQHCLMARRHWHLRLRPHPTVTPPTPPRLPTTLRPPTTPPPPTTLTMPTQRHRDATAAAATSLSLPRHLKMSLSSKYRRHRRHALYRCARVRAAMKLSAHRPSSSPIEYRFVMSSTTVCIEKEDSMTGKQQVCGVRWCERTTDAGGASAVGSNVVA